MNMSIKDKLKSKIENKYNYKRSEWELKAEGYLKDENKLKKLIKKAVLKAEENKKGPIGKLFNNILLLISLIKDYIKGEYRDIPYGSLIMMIAGILYFVTPIDIIPDFILSLGFIDDAVVLGLILKQLDADLEKYVKWKNN